MSDDSLGYEANIEGQMQSALDELEGQETEPVEDEPAPVVVAPQPVLNQERGGVAWCELWGKAKDEAGQVHPVKINITNRGENAEQALRGLLQALSIAKAEFHLNPYPPQFGNAPAPVQTQAPAAVTPPPPSGGTNPPPPAPGNPVEMQTGQPTAGGTMDIQKVEVQPRPDGKVTVSLFQAGHKFADLKMVGTAEQMAARFGGGWQKEHFAQVASYNVSLKVAWQNSTNLNSQGNPYKNVTGINQG